MTGRRARTERLVQDGALRGGRLTAYATPDRFREAAGRVPHWTMAAILMVLLHAFWLLWLSPAAPDPAFRPRTGTRLTYLTPDLVPDLAGAWVLSPALGALLSPSGIGDLPPTRELAGTPDLQAPRTPLTFFERDRYAAADVPPLDPPSRADAAAAAWPAPGAPGGGPTESVLDAVRVERLEGFRMTLSEGLRREDLAGIEVPGALPRDDRMVWDAVAWIEFNAEGGVDHVFLEQTSGDAERDRNLVRSLYQWRLTPQAETREGRVTMSFFRRAAAPAGDGTDTP